MGTRTVLEGGVTGATSISNADVPGTIARHRPASAASDTLLQPES
jgi:hypothetical protein